MFITNITKIGAPYAPDFNISLGDTFDETVWGNLETQMLGPVFEEDVCALAYLFVCVINYTAYFLISTLHRGFVADEDRFFCTRFHNSFG